MQPSYVVARKVLVVYLSCSAVVSCRQLLVQTSGEWRAQRWVLKIYRSPRRDYQSVLCPSETRVKLEWIQRERCSMEQGGTLHRLSYTLCFGTKWCLWVFAQCKSPRWVLKDTLV